MMKKKKFRLAIKMHLGPIHLFECVHFIIQEIISLGEFWDRMEDSVQITLSERYVCTGEVDCGSCIVTAALVTV